MEEPMDIDAPPKDIETKEDDTRPLRKLPKRIEALDENIINRIAAGEIIVAPANALKELIENSVDAGATHIEILVKDGGLKLLQITDDGCGINRDDLPILCERFTTSKLKAFEDLSSIGTYGFRGEALSSISHIAHLTVTTRTEDQNCAWRAHYGDGILVPQKPGQPADPKPCAGRLGTQIMIEDLFYNVPLRRNSFRSFNDEHSKVVDMAGRYAVHCSGISFSCKRHGDSTMDLSIQNQTNTIDRIRRIYGAALVNELLTISTSSSTWGFKVTGYVSNANYHCKKLALLLFINHRCVESINIRKAIQQTYFPFLPKGKHPFVYLDLEIDPQRLDVNVHPTKREVRFLQEEEITEQICDCIKDELANVDSSRAFTAQTIKSSTIDSIQTDTSPHDVQTSTDSASQSTPPASQVRPSPPSVSKIPRRPAKRASRVDPTLRKITDIDISVIKSLQDQDADQDEGQGQDQDLDQEQDQDQGQVQGQDFDQDQDEDKDEDEVEVEDHDSDLDLDQDQDKNQEEDQGHDSDLDPDQDQDENQEDQGHDSDLDLDLDLDQDQDKNHEDHDQVQTQDQNLDEDEDLDLDQDQDQDKNHEDHDQDLDEDEDLEQGLDQNQGQDKDEYQSEDEHQNQGLGLDQDQDEYHPKYHGLDLDQLQALYLAQDLDEDEEEDLGLYQHQDQVENQYQNQTEFKAYTVHPPREIVQCKLTSIERLRDSVLSKTNNDLTNIIYNHTFIGVMDTEKRIAAIQAGIKLFTVNYGLFCKEFFYQLGLSDFGNFGTIKFNPPLSLKPLLRLAMMTDLLLSDIPSRRSKAGTKLTEEDIIAMLMDHRAMLAEYFSFNLSEDGHLETIPLLLDGYMPSLLRLPQFILHIALEVDWESEQECFRTFLTELADFYSLDSFPNVPDPVTPTSSLSPPPFPGSSDEEAGAEYEYEGEIKGGIEEEIFEREDKDVVEEGHGNDLGYEEKQAEKEDGHEGEREEHEDKDGVEGDEYDMEYEEEEHEGENEEDKKGVEGDECDMEYEEEHEEEEDGVEGDECDMEYEEKQGVEEEGEHEEEEDKDGVEGDEYDMEYEEENRVEEEDHEGENEEDKGGVEGDEHGVESEEENRVGDEDEDKERENKERVEEEKIEDKDEGDMDYEESRAEDKKEDKKEDKVEENKETKSRDLFLSILARSIFEDEGSLWDDFEGEDIDPLDDEDKEFVRERSKEVRRVLEKVLFPAFRTQLVATNNLMRGVREIANLEKLYKAFERC